MSNQSDTGNLIKDNYHYFTLWGITMTPEITKLLRGNLWPYGIMGISAYNVTEGVKLNIIKAEDAQIVYIVLVVTAIIYGLVIEFVKSYQSHIQDLREREERILKTNDDIATALIGIEGKIVSLSDSIKSNDILRDLKSYLEKSKEVK